MKLKMLPATAVAALLAAGPAALAQTSPPASPAPDAPAEKIAPPMDSAAAPSPGAAQQQSADELRSSKLVGLAVYNAAGDRIGDINELIVDSQGQISSVVVGVGGFLGLGEKLVALPFKDINFSRDENGNLRASTNSTKETLEAAPDYKYHDASKK